MEEPSMCRICLAVDVRMHLIVTTHLQEMYESLSMTPFKTLDNRPMQACYICFARLKNCYQLRQSCVQSEELLTEMLSSNMVNPARLRERAGAKELKVTHPVMRLTVEDAVGQNTDCNVLREAYDVYFDVKIEPIEERDPLEEDVLEAEYDVPRYHVPLDSVKNEPALFDINIKNEPSEETEENMQPSDLEDDLPLEVMKRELDDDNTSRRGSEEMGPPTTRLKSGSRASLKIHQSLTNNSMISSPSTSNIYNSGIFNVNIDYDNSNMATLLIEGYGQNTQTINQYEYNTDQKIKKKVFRTSAGPRPFQCDVCKKRFKRKDNLEGHLRTHAVIKPYQCNVCDKSFIRKHGLENHLRLHTGEKPYQCDICNKSYRVKNSLDSHVSTHTGEKPFKCDVCQKCFNQKCVLDSHVRLHTDERPHECSFCKKRFNHKGNLNSHIRVHTREKPNQCNTCKKCYKLKTNLDNHKCPHRPFQCKVCEKTFAVKINLDNHIRIHTGEKPYQCYVCNKSFSQRGILDNHIRTHTGLKPYQCHVCDKCFTRKGHLESHSRVHNGTKPFQCDVCKKCFGRQSILDSHRLLHSR